jgi:uncharacterized protein
MPPARYRSSALLALRLMQKQRSAKVSVARWTNWKGEGLEHLVLRQASDGIVAESVVVGKAARRSFALRYRIDCDSSWRVRKVAVHLLGGDAIELNSDSRGTWFDKSRRAQRKLAGAIDVDISATPFTNTLPVRRLNLGDGESKEIAVVYLLVPQLKVSLDRQRYTRLDRRHYRYESVDSDFRRDIEIDGGGLVVSYPGLFRRVVQAN